MSENGRVIRYTVRSSDGHRVATTAELLTPSGPAPARGWPVVVYGHGTSGLGPAAFTPPRPRPVDEQRYLGSLVEQGWAVVAPTYLLVGDPPVHTYLDGPDEAIAMVGALQAARRADPGLGARWVAHGGSQGGHAALWAAARARFLAPELPLAGTLALCPASHVETVLRLIDPRLPSRCTTALVSTAMMICAGLDAALPALGVPRWLTPAGRELLGRVASLDVDAIAALTAGVRVRDVVALPLLSGALGTQLRPRLRVPVAIPGPVRIVHGRHDHTVPLALSVALTARMRAAGTQVRLQTVPSDHHDIVVHGGELARATMARLFGE